VDASRFSRQTILREVGRAGQALLNEARVLIVGAGGLGSPAALYLAAAGVQLTIIDDDCVDESNLGRQILHAYTNIGQAKIDSARHRLESIHPDVQVEIVKDRFNVGNAAQLVREHHFVLDGSDNFSTKFLINDSCVLNRKAYSHAGVLGWGGQTFTYIPEAPCYRCLFIEPPPINVVPNCSQFGVMGPVVGLLGCLQATEAIKCILGKTDQLLTGQLLTIDAIDMKFRKVQFLRNPNCPICSSKASIAELVESGVQQCDLKQVKQNTWLITFEGSQKVLKAERHLKQLGYQVEPRITPRQLSNECGICLQLNSETCAEVKAEFKQLQLQWIRFVNLQELT